MPNKEAEDLSPIEAVPEDHLPVETDRDTVDHENTPFTGDFMEVTIEVSEQLVRYEKALDAIMNFIIRRTYPGDWVCHAKASDPIEERVVNMIGAAAERVARDLGIQEKNRTAPVKKWDEKNPGHYSYSCEADFTFRGRTIHAFGEASSRNPFHAKAYGQAVKPEDIREDYIRREAIRDCVKEGIRTLFGLRRIPLMKLKELGYDIEKVKYVNFKSDAKSQAATNAQATAAPQEAQKPVADTEQITITIDNISAKVSKNGKAFSAIRDQEGVTYTAWGDSKSVLIIDLMAGWKAGKPIAVMFKGGQYPTITAVVKP